jgi:hypothetical protein
MTIDKKRKLLESAYQDPFEELFRIVQAQEAEE